MSKTQDYRNFSNECFQFIAGLSDVRPESDINFRHFIDARSRVSELHKMRQHHAVINKKYKKGELIEFFLNLQGFQRKKLLEKIPDMITVLPADCKNFKIPRPEAIAYRFANFGGKTVEYPVYKVLDFLQFVERFNQLPQQ